jgi:hypothetical protein
MPEQVEKVTILAPDWPPRRTLQKRPGDLSHMLPQGLGLDVPFIVTPYGSGPWLVTK